MKHLKLFLLIGLLSMVTLQIQSCSYAQANVQTLVTSDCGVTWKVIPAGQSVPAQITVCSYKVTVPDYSMQGQIVFKASFKGKVLSLNDVDYDYSIVNAEKFIGAAKRLGKPNSASDDESNNSAVFEGAENSVINKQIKNIAGNLLINQDIVEFSQAEFEDMLTLELNKALEYAGVKINFITFVPVPEEQTRQAIDMVTAMKIYENNGLTDVGKSVATARAGANKIEVKVSKENTATE